MSKLEGDKPLAEQDTLAASQLSRVDELAELAWQLRHRNPTQALEVAERGLALATALSYDKGKAYSLVAQAFAYFRLARLHDAQESAQAGYALFAGLEQPHGTVRALNTLGMVYGESGELLKALEAFLTVDSLCKELGDKVGEADALNNIGNVYAYLGDHVNALDYYQQSLKVCNDDEVTLAEAKPRALLNIGVSYYELGQFDTALEYFSYALSSEAADPYLNALCFLHFGRSHKQLGKLELAQAYLQQSLTLSQAADNPHVMGGTLDSIADISLTLGHLAEAQATLQQSLALKEAEGNPQGQSETLLLLAQVDLRNHDFRRARERLERVLEITEKVGNLTERYGALRQLSEVYEQQGDYRRALEFYQRYNELHEKVSRGTVSQQLQGLRLRFEISQSAREKEIYRLKSAELAQLNADLYALNKALRDADEEKTRLLLILERQAEEDALTGLYNRRRFDELFAHSFTQAQRLGTKLSVVIGDIDDFKGVNDCFSHPIGDAVLKTVAGLIKESVRTIDTIARYGGEEFVMLLPGASGQDALIICERLRRAVETHDWERVHPELQVTLSLGISDDLSSLNHERMMALADAKLYKAKRRGKNQVIL